MQANALVCASQIQGPRCHRVRRLTLRPLTSKRKSPHLRSRKGRRLSRTLASASSLFTSQALRLAQSSRLSRCFPSQGHSTQSLSSATRRTCPRDHASMLAACSNSSHGRYHTCGHSSIGTSLRQTRLPNKPSRERCTGSSARRHRPCSRHAHGGRRRRS